jgi:hypothetical protein
MSKTKELSSSVSLERLQPVTQVIHQIFIPEHPTGLIGEKVTYSEKYLKYVKGSPSIPLPHHGYFTIIKAILKNDGRVMIGLNDCERYTGLDGTNIALSNLIKYEN